MHSQTQWPLLTLLRLLPLLSGVYFSPRRTLPSVLNFGPSGVFALCVDKHSGHIIITRKGVFATN